MWLIVGYCACYARGFKVYHNTLNSRQETFIVVSVCRGTVFVSLWILTEVADERTRRRCSRLKGRSIPQFISCIHARRTTQNHQEKKGAKCTKTNKSARCKSHRLIRGMTTASTQLFLARLPSFRLVLLYKDGGKADLLRNIKAHTLRQVDIPQTRHHSAIATVVLTRFLRFPPFNLRKQLSAGERWMAALPQTSIRMTSRLSASIKVYRRRRMRRHIRRQGCDIIDMSCGCR